MALPRRIAPVTAQAARALRALSRHRGGISAIETALLLPVFLTFLLGIFEFSRLLWTQGTLQYAVGAAARCASFNANQCGNASAIQSYAASQVAGITVNATDFTVTTPSCGNNVSVSETFTFVAATLLPWGPITLNAQACQPAPHG